MTQNKTEVPVIRQERLLRFLWRDRILPFGTKPKYFPGEIVQTYEALIGIGLTPGYATCGPFLSEEAVERAVRGLGEDWKISFERCESVQDVRQKVGKYTIVTRTSQVSRW